MTDTKRAGGLFAAAVAAAAALAEPRGAAAQHVTAAMMAQASGAAGCEQRARQAAKLLDALNADLARARQTGNETEMRAAIDAVNKSFADLKVRLTACRAGAQTPASGLGPAPPPAPSAGGTTGIDHSKMNMGQAQPGGVKPAAGAMDHAAMGHAEPAGAAAAPTTVRQISGPAEAALQSFLDALQVGNRDVAWQWLAPDATITEAGVTHGSPGAYANQHMGFDMAFLKTARVVLLDRQVHPAGDSARIVSTSRITGRAGGIPVDVTVTEGALLKNTAQGWRIVSLEWTVAPLKQEKP